MNRRRVAIQPACGKTLRCGMRQPPWSFAAWSTRALTEKSAGVSVDPGSGADAQNRCGINHGREPAEEDFPWLVDLISGHPLFYTPNVLGTALFHQGAGLDQPQALPISLDTVVAYTWIHGLVFCAIGGVAAKLLELADHDVHIGFGVLLLAVIFAFAFVG